MKADQGGGQKMKGQAKTNGAPKPLGRPPLAPELRRSARLSMRTYSDIEEKARRVGTEAVENAIRKIKE